MDVIIVGGGIGGLTLALALHKAGIPSRVYEAAPQTKPLGVGINLLPHCSKVLCGLGLESELSRVAVTTSWAIFYNRFGQLIYTEPLGRRAGYAWPQFSIHRADLHGVLLDALKTRLGAERFLTGWKYTRFEQDDGGASAWFEDTLTGAPLPPQEGAALIGCDGLHSVVRKQLHPGEGAPIYSGVNMWRGATRWRPILDGASMIRAGWLTPGKMVIYPIRDRVDDEARQLVNWVAEIQTPKHPTRDWNRAGRLEDFIGVFEDWRYDWLDVPALIRAADLVLEFPMIDQEPLPWWSQGRVTLLGDAAHPMYPRGSNGAGQAILDAKALADCFSAHREPVEALKTYDRKRVGPTSDVVRMNRKNPPDAILREVYERTGDRPFGRIDEVISQEELKAISDGYKRVAQYDHALL